MSPTAIPANDMPAVMMCLGATYHVAGKSGERRDCSAGISTRAPISPRSRAGDVLTAVRIPVPAAGHGYAYEKLKRKIGDYATAAAAVVLTMKGGKVETCSIGLTNVAETPLWAEEAAKILVGSAPDAATVERAAAAAEAITAPAEDARGPARYGTKMAGVMLTRALGRAKSLATRLRGKPMAKSRVAMKVNGKTVEALVEPRMLLHPFPARRAQYHRTAYRLRDQRLRRLHRRSQRQIGQILHNVRGAGRWRRDPHHRGYGEYRRHAACAAGRLSRNAWIAMRLLHARNDRPRVPAAPGKPQSVGGGNPLRRLGNLFHCTGYRMLVKAIQFAAAKIAGVPFQEAAE